MVKLFNNSGFKWIQNEFIWFKGHIHDFEKIRSLNQIFNELAEISDESDFNTWLKSANGCFSLIIQRPGFICAAVDPIRSLPLFYSTAGSELILTDNPVKCFGNDSRIDECALLELESAAFVCGKKTLYSHLFQLQAGEYLFFEQGSLNTRFYFQASYQNLDQSPFDELKIKLNNNLEIVFKRLLDSLGGRQAVIPLSGGYDSRLIALMLAKQGYKKILTFTYGRKDNFELENSHNTAKVLGLPWIFIDYNPELINGFIASETFKEYFHFAGKASSMFYMQDYFAVKYLHDNQLIEKDAIFIPGHSGDFVAGSHLRENMKGINRMRKLEKLICRTTFQYNRHHHQKKNLLSREVKKFIKEKEAFITGWQLVEYWDFMERQAKFIVNSTSVFDFFGYEFRLPYWDKTLTGFLNSLSFENKIYKKLYNNTLEELYFKPFNLHFKRELQVSRFQVLLQQLKNRIKPHLPKTIKEKFLEKNDWMAYSIITKEMLNDLKKRGIKYSFRADGYNAIISYWYLSFFIRRRKNNE